MSPRTVKAFGAHCAAQGRPVSKAVDITGRIPRGAALSTSEAPSGETTTASTPQPRSVALRGAEEFLRTTKTRPVADERLAVTLTLGELRELMHDAALEAVAEAAGADRPALLDRNGLAQALGVGVSMVDRFRREGCPVLWAGDSPRFELPDFLEWLRGREAP